MRDLPLPPVPNALLGLWERTLLETWEDGTTQRDTETRVFWLQTPHWHADLRIPTHRPDFSGVTNLEACSDDQLRFIASQEAFCGLTRVEGAYCSWLRLHDLHAGLAPDIGRIDYADTDFLIEHGVASAYLEHWHRVTGSIPNADEDPFAQSPPFEQTLDGLLCLTSAGWRITVRPRTIAPEDCNPYAPLTELTRAALLWRASLEITLSKAVDGDWRPVLSTHPWVEAN